jgi:hypothetical protein
MQRPPARRRSASQGSGGAALHGSTSRGRGLGGTKCAQGGAYAVGAGTRVGANTLVRMGVAAAADLPVAIKFYARREAFERECRLLALGLEKQYLPKVYQVVEATESFPAFVVYERGKYTMSEWLRRAEPSAAEKKRLLQEVRAALIGEPPGRRTFFAAALFGADLALPRACRPAPGPSGRRANKQTDRQTDGHAARHRGRAWRIRGVWHGGHSVCPSAEQPAGAGGRHRGAWHSVYPSARHPAGAGGRHRGARLRAGGVGPGPPAPVGRRAHGRAARVRHALRDRGGRPLEAGRVWEVGVHGRHLRLRLPAARHAAGGEGLGIRV